MTDKDLTDKTVQNSTEHLKPYQFKPGESGNPAGRPKNALTIKNALGRMADEIPEDSEKPRHELLSEYCWAQALKGDRWFIQFVTEHKEGKPSQTNINIETDPDEVKEIG